MENGSLLDVGNGHKIYYERHGNVSGPTFLYLLGGPGVGLTESDKKFFDFDKANVIFFDQRGCGRSEYTSLTDANTTSDLVSDINLLLDHFEVEQIHLFGGSWGSTLAMIYAIKNADRVASMTLRGFFDGSLANRDFFENGAVADHFPNIWQRYAIIAPAGDYENISSFYYKTILAQENNWKKYAYELEYYGSSLAKKEVDFSKIDKAIKSTSFLNSSIVFSHYSVNDFFIPDGYIFDNIDHVKHIPTKIVHGEHDMICPVSFAEKLDQLMEQSDLIVVDAGHASSEPAIEKELRSQLENLYASFQ